MTGSQRDRLPCFLSRREGAREGRRERGKERGWRMGIGEGGMKKEKIIRRKDEGRKGQKGCKEEEEEVV